MIKRIIFLPILSIFLLSSYSFGSQISQITLSELQEKADLIVLAQVTNVKQNGNIDKVTIKIDSCIKGKTEEKELSFILSTRGGLKDFDPSLNIGNTGVFFLKQNGKEVKKAYWGSVAIFPNYIFKLTGE